MKYIAFAFVVVILIGFARSCNYGLTQEACMTEGRVLYKSNCVLYDSIPYDDRDKVIQEVADEKGISYDEAFDLISE